MDLSILKIAQALYGCVLTQYPDLAKSVLEFVGGATLLYRGVAALRSFAGQGHLPEGGLMRMLAGLALNRAPEAPSAEPVERVRGGGR